MEQKQEKDKENVQLPIEPFLRLTSKPIKGENSLGLLYFPCDKCNATGNGSHFLLLTHVSQFLCQCHEFHETCHSVAFYFMKNLFFYIVCIQQRSKSYYPCTLEHGIDNNISLSDCQISSEYSQITPFLFSV